LLRSCGCCGLRIAGILLQKRPHRRTRKPPKQGQRSCIAPILRPVPDVQDFDNFFGGLSGSAKAREGRQLINPFDKRLSDTPGSGRVVLLDVFKLTAASSWSDTSDVHRMSLTSETAGRYGEARLGGLQTHPGRLARHLFAHRRRTGPDFRACGQRFNLGREMYSHALQGTRKPAVGQHGRRKASTSSTEAAPRPPTTR
jgi:hypothetical protein